MHFSSVNGGAIAFGILVLKHSLLDTDGTLGPLGAAAASEMAWRTPSLNGMRNGPTGAAL